MSALLIDGARLLDGHPASIVAVDGRIGAIAASGPELPPGTRRLDATGLVAAPGFIDLQVNGAAGCDITSEPGAMWRIGETLARHGVTAFLATIVSSPPERMRAAIDAFAAGMPGPGAVPIGLHLEGPYLARAGAHRPEALRAPDPSEAGSWTRDAGVRMVTLAPELPGAMDVISQLADGGVVVAAGHSGADAATGRAAIEAGVRYATHLPNAMHRLDHPTPTLAAALLDDDRVTVGLIADGIHVAPEMIARVWQAAGGGRVSLVSDAMAGLGVRAGRVRLGDAEVTIGADGARLGDGTLAGALAGLDVGVRTAMAATGRSLAEVIAAVTSTPARLLGLRDGRGTIELGGRADITLLTPAAEVAATVVGGEIAWLPEATRWA